MNPLTIERSVHFRCGRRSRKELKTGQEPAPPPEPLGRVPRVAKLMALAIRFQGLLRDGIVTDYDKLATLCHVTRARVCQIMNLLQLAPDIQEAILFLPRVERGRDPISLWQLQPIAAMLEWRRAAADVGAVAAMSELHWCRRSGKASVRAQTACS